MIVTTIKFFRIIIITTIQTAMNKSLELLKRGFESSSGTTEEFKNFYKTFKTEFTRELKSIGATNIVFSRGHFYISGFFTANNQFWYFSIPDVREFSYGLFHNPNSCMTKLLYREVKDYKDYTGGHNRYATIKLDMAADICWSFKTI